MNLLAKVMNITIIVMTMALTMSIGTKQCIFRKMVMVETMSLMNMMKMVLNCILTLNGSRGNCPMRTVVLEPAAVYDAGNGPPTAAVIC